VNSTQSAWFEVNLDTLRLKQVDMHGWPEGMTRAASRMKEECLENVVALNLDVLFPGEDLLLVGNQFPDWSETDLLAIDRFGLLRLMELKKGPARLGALQDQAIGYGLARDYMPDWKEHMARGLPYLPERLELGLDGFRLNERTEMLGEKFIRKHAPSLLQEPWSHWDRFEKAHVLACALRVYRGAPSGLVALQNPLVRDIADRLYGLSLEELAYSEPDETLERILDKKWGFTPTQSNTEFTLIAAGLSREKDAEIPLENRGACFHLIDAELRHVAGRAGVQRAVLRWQPVRRTLSTHQLQTAIALQQLVEQRSRQAARFYWEPGSICGPLYWRRPRHVFLRVEDAQDRSQILVTRADGLTEGLADLRLARRRALRKLRDPLARHGIFPVGAELAAPWDPENLEPAAELTAAYFRMVQELGFLDLDKYTWYRRPQNTRPGRQ
jgi:hypothetical protein